MQRFRTGIPAAKCIPPMTIPNSLVLGLVAAEGHLRSHILDLSGFKLRRWIATSEGWDDDDKAFVRILNQGTSRETLIAELDAPPNGGPATRSGNSGIAKGSRSVS